MSLPQTKQNKNLLLIFLGEDRRKTEKRNFPNDHPIILLGHRAIIEKSRAEMVAQRPRQEERCAQLEPGCPSVWHTKPFRPCWALDDWCEFSPPPAAQPRGTNPCIFNGMSRSSGTEERGEKKTFPCKQVCSVTTNECIFKIHIGFASQGPWCCSQREGWQSSFVCVPLWPRVVPGTAVSSEAWLALGRRRT